MIRWTRLWSEQPSGGRGDEVYESLMFAYNKSKVLFSLVWHFTYWVKVGKGEDREAWLKSPEMRRRD